MEADDTAVIGRVRTDADAGLGWLEQKWRQDWEGLG